MYCNHLCIPAENKMASVIMVHCSNSIIKSGFINNPSRAEIKHLIWQHHELIISYVFGQLCQSRVTNSARDICMSGNQLL